MLLKNAKTYCARTSTGIVQVGGGWIQLLIFLINTLKYLLKSFQGNVKAPFLDNSSLQL